ncbi:hypothetical protein OEZ85_010084 [Tetradesmus obliquus]|uniref:Uncharacterized protein n=1 Tax=Tetradesmus obliquus TaxID=3088 RepID=A0ABY8TLI9_TETOB|nr:hypothetical protein OEZ85_010084 [Tetradesmus obliquus]
MQAALIPLHSNEDEILSYGTDGVNEQGDHVTSQQTDGGMPSGPADSAEHQAAADSDEDSSHEPTADDDEEQQAAAEMDWQEPVPTSSFYTQRYAATMRLTGLPVESEGLSVQEVVCLLRDDEVKATAIEYAERSAAFSPFQRECAAFLKELLEERSAFTLKG